MTDIERVNELRSFWGNEATDKILLAIARDGRKEFTFRYFLTYCTACGGNWGGMLLTGIKRLFPTVWDAIPNEMGIFAFEGICNVMVLCGIIEPSNEEG